MTSLGPWVEQLLEVCLGIFGKGFIFPFRVATLKKFKRCPLLKGHGKNSASMSLDEFLLTRPVGMARKTKQITHRERKHNKNISNIRFEIAPTKSYISIAEKLGYAEFHTTECPSNAQRL